MSARADARARRGRYASNATASTIHVGSTEPALALHAFRLAAAGSIGVGSNAARSAAGVSRLAQFAHNDEHGGEVVIAR